jgi:photosystem II stability/assembly factor-like uncharacterized protein
MRISPLKKVSAASLQTLLTTCCKSAFLSYICLAILTPKQMKKILLSLFSLCSFATFGQWAYTSNNSSGDVVNAFGKTFASDGLISNTSGLFSSTDNGATWAPSNTGVPTTGLIFGTLDATNLYAYRTNSVFASTTGNNWTAMASTVASSLIIKGMTTLNGTVIAIASPNSPVSFKVLHYNAGSWSVKSSPTNSCLSTCIRNLGGTLYAGTTASNVLKSTDGGMTWTGGLTGMPTENCNKYAASLASSGNTLFCGSAGGKISRSTDNGATWSPVKNLGDNNIFGIFINDFYVFNPTTVFAATDSGFVYTTDGGANWIRYCNGLSLSNGEWSMKRVTVSGNYIVGAVATLGNPRVVRMPLSTIGLSASTGINANVAVFENKVYPNPTSDKVVIEAGDLAFEDDCNVNVYDVMGKQVGTSLMHSGKTELNVGNYTKGLYTFTISSKGVIASRGKFIVN